MSEKRQSEDIESKNGPDGAPTERKETVGAHLERARELFEAHGSSITFQVFRINVHANNLTELQGKKLAEFTVAGDVISGDDTVSMVKEKVRSSLQGNIKDGDQITFYFGGRPMREDALFYADHFMILPVWIQLSLHACEFREVEAAIRRLKKSNTLPPL